MNARFATVAMAYVSVLIATLNAEDSPKPSDPAKEHFDRLLQQYHREASEYAMTLPDSDVELSLREEPIFIWMNRARPGTPRVQHGALFVWTSNGRAEAVGSIFSVDREDQAPYTLHEFHSLATEPLKAIHRGEVEWNTTEKGISPQPFPDTSPPSATGPQRLLEMRSLARRFSGHSIHYDGTRWDLNLLPQHLYRIPEGTGDVQDGAIFALVSTAGTDPEVLLVIESRRAGDQYQWQYGVCRFTDLKTIVALDGTPVWTFANGSTGTYTDAGTENRYRIRYNGELSSFGR